MKHRQYVKDVAFLNDMRVLLASLERQAITEGDYPAECPVAVAPRGFAEYMLRRFDWRRETPIGGYWDWEHKTGNNGELIGLAVKNPTRTTIQMKAIDAKLDDGSIYTGSFQQLLTIVARVLALFAGDEMKRMCITALLVCLAPVLNVIY